MRGKRGRLDGFLRELSKVALENWLCGGQLFVSALTSMQLAAQVLGNGDTCLSDGGYFFRCCFLYKLELHCHSSALPAKYIVW